MPTPIAEMTTSLEKARKANRIWFYSPQWYWFGWVSLLPLQIGHDECARRTLVIGWTVTGRVVIPLWSCDYPECLEDAEENAKMEGF